MKFFSKEIAMNKTKKDYPNIFTLKNIAKTAQKEEENKIKKEKAEKRAYEMIELKKDGKTLQKIGDKFGVSRERVRQILFQYGITGRQYPAEQGNRVEKEILQCLKCGDDFEVSKNAKRKKRHCSSMCFKTDNMFNKPHKDWTKEDMKEYNKARNSLPKAIKARRKYFLDNKEEIYKKNIEWHKSPKGRKYLREYAKRPDVALKRKIRYKERLANDPEFLDRIRFYGRRTYRRMMSDPIKAKEIREKALARYYKITSDPVKLKEQQRKNREKYLKSKNENK